MFSICNIQQMSPCICNVWCENHFVLFLFHLAFIKLLWWLLLLIFKQKANTGLYSHSPFQSWPCSPSFLLNHGFFSLPFEQPDLALQNNGWKPFPIFDHTLFPEILPALTGPSEGRNHSPDTQGVDGPLLFPLSIYSVFLRSSKYLLHFFDCCQTQGWWFHCTV